LIAVRTAIAIGVVTAPLPGCLAGADDASPVYAGGPLVIDVTGDDYEWHIRYPGADGAAGTDDDVVTLRHLHLPEHTPVTLRLHSADYLYTFGLPHLDLKEIAVPDLVFTLEFETAAAGAFELRGDQMCGYTHPSLIGRVIVEPPSQFVRWLETVRDA
jgi:cytochrome c oxidase subunit 2